jgi:tRNA nucleotidyltransferase (CCA-adding enzyme)
MENFTFATPEITQAEIAQFAAQKVNLRSEDADVYRTQVKNLREHLERYISEHPEIGLAKMVLSGSLAKGTSLRSLRDIDVAVYVKGEGVAPTELAPLLELLQARLRTTYSQIPKDRIKIDGPCIVISFAGTGLDVEVAPIYYTGDPQWRGYLWDRQTGNKILTSIPLHLDFIRKRKEQQPTHFSQVIRLLKWWVQQRQADTSNFAFRSFLVELIMAKLADNGTNFSDYHTGLEHFFVYIQNSGLKKRIAFNDNYGPAELPAATSGVVEIFDPVNPQNNVAFDITELARKQLIQLADRALDALSYARNSQTKGDAIECWREVMGASFSV